MHEKCRSVSVIVATYNRGATLADTIESVLKSDYPRFELVVVDQTAHYPAAVERRLRALQERHDYRHLQLPAANLPLARNVGLRRTTGEVVLFCDDDVLVEPDFAARHARRYDDPAVGAVAGRVITQGYEPDAERAAGAVVGRLGAYEPVQGHFYKREADGPVEWGMGCNMSFRRAALEAAGGFDERYEGVALHEDADAFVRVRRQGYRAVFAPDASLVHRKSPSGGCRNQEAFRRRRRSVIRNRALFQSGYRPARDAAGAMGFLSRGLRAGLHAADEYQRAHGELRDTYECLPRALRRLAALPQAVRFFGAYLAGLRARYDGDPRHRSARLAPRAVQSRFRSSHPSVTTA
jgi:GT2 family glycosyltransferase